jgi:DNA-binding response OmpR family regulator
MRIIVIRDNRAFAANMGEYLSAKGHVVDVAEDGTGGLRQALLKQYDAIVLDRVLQDMDGLELCRELRGDLRNTPILMLSSRDNMRDRIAALDDGVSEYVLTPASLGDIEGRLQTMYSRRNAESAGCPA